MGDKIQSKIIAEEAGVNVIPEFNEALQNAEQAVKVAAKIGYPVMLKASAGGGGKGMRIAYDDQQCADGFIRAQNESLASFGDNRVLQKNTLLSLIISKFKSWLTNKAILFISAKENAPYKEGTKK